MAKSEKVVEAILQASDNATVTDYLVRRAADPVDPEWIRLWRRIDLRFVARRRAVVTRATKVRTTLLVRSPKPFPASLDTGLGFQLLSGLDQ
jgi:hypothetical protein